MHKEAISATQVQYCSIDENHIGQRIDNYLLFLLKNIPKSRVYKMLRTGEVRVNKKRVKPEYRIQLGDSIRIPPVSLPTVRKNLNPQGPAVMRIADMILYEDDGLLVLNKPAGLAVHGGSGVSYGLIELARSYRADLRYLELVHRLDRDTSGCILIAKKRGVLKELHQQLRMGQVEKIYLTLVHGPVKKQKFNVDAP
jgi:23S rRNA pseudouridine955/2504/2580 synthase